MLGLVAKVSDLLGPECICGCGEPLSDDVPVIPIPRPHYNRACRRSILRLSRRLMGRPRNSQKGAKKGSRNTPDSLSTPIEEIMENPPQPSGSSGDDEITESTEQDGNMAETAPPLNSASRSVDDSAQAANTQQGTATASADRLQGDYEAQLANLIGRIAVLEQDNQALRTAANQPRSGTSTPAQEVQEINRSSQRTGEAPLRPLQTMPVQEGETNPPPQIVVGTHASPTAATSHQPPIRHPQPHHACCSGTMPQRMANSPSREQREPVYLGRDEVPTFKGDTPASKPLVRNQEVEAWISTIEALTRPPTDEAFIRMAKGRARGYAQYLLLSPMFQYISSWYEFKAQLRAKFRGIYTSESFFEMLSQSRMIPGQAPLDYYQQIEMVVYQGVRDFPQEVGDAEGLIRRTFRAGLPAWLKQQMALHTFPSVAAMAERVQSAWDATVGARSTLPQVRQITSLGDSYPGAQPVVPQPVLPQMFPPAQALPAGAVPGLEYYSDVPFSVHATQSRPQTIPTRGSQGQGYRPGPNQQQYAMQQKKWCSYHQVTSHNTSDCKTSNRLCFICGQPGHFAARCPNSSRQQNPMAATPVSRTSEFRCFVCGNPSHGAANCPFSYRQQGTTSTTPAGRTSSAQGETNNPAEGER